LNVVSDSNLSEMIKSNPDIVRKSISLSSTVAQWANELAHKKGFGSNFSAYIADLIRHDQHRDALVATAGNRLTGPVTRVNSLTKTQAAEQVVAIVQDAARRRTSARQK
jgi:hypothetical protein